MNERWLRVVRLLTATLRAIQQSIATANEQARANNRGEQPPIRVDIQSAPIIPPAVTEYYTSENRERKGKNIRETIRLVLETVGVVAAISAAVFTLRTLHQVQEQIGIMQKQLEQSDRAWIKVEVDPLMGAPNSLIPTSLFFDRDGVGHLGVHTALNNIGKSVASHVQVRIDALATSLTEYFRTPVEEQKALCDKPPQPGSIDAATTIFPGDKDEGQWALSFQTRSVPATIPGMSLGKAITVVVYGCVDYDFANAMKMHQTGFLYEVRIVSPEHGIQVGLPPTPNSRLTFVLHVLGAGSTN